MEGTVDGASGPPARKGLKVLALASFAILVVICLSYLSAYSLQWHRRRFAKEFVGELKRLEVGKTTEAEVKAISDRYTGKYSPAGIQDQVPQPAYYEVAVESPNVIIGNSARTLPGLKIWWFVVTLGIEHGYLTDVQLSEYVRRSDDFELSSQVRLAGNDNWETPGAAPYKVREAHITGPPGEALIVELGPTATQEQREKGFDFNFSCLTAVRECRHVCDTMPSAWKDLQPSARLTYEDGGFVYDYSECGKVSP